jgi:hypothetical protein
MSADYWEDLKEEICTQLLIGKENGEAELETMARIVWSERQTCVSHAVGLDGALARAGGTLFA